MQTEGKMQTVEGRPGVKIMQTVEGRPGVKIMQTE